MNLEALSMLKLLSMTPPFAGLPQAEREAMLPRLRLQGFSPKEVIFSEGEPAAVTWIVHTGKVRIQVFYSGARQVQMEHLQRGDIFGLFCRMGGGRARETYPCTAVAEGRVMAVRVPDELFQGLYRRHASVARESCELCSLRLGAIQKLVSFGREPAERRVAEVLVRLHRRSGARVLATRQDIAVQAGTTLETVFRVLAGFRKRGWVETLRGAIRLKNPAALQAHVGGRGKN